MRMRFPAVAGMAFLALTATSPAPFHLMQIEEVIAGVDGDPTAQAIELRLRSAGQTQVGGAELVAYDANGQNPVVLLNISASVMSGSAGANILLTSAAFNALMVGVAGYSSDFTLTNTIPTSYLRGGRVTFEQDSATPGQTANILWTVTFGNYTGPTAKATTNSSGSVGNSPAVPTTGLPTSGKQGILYTGAASGTNSNNSTDYALTADPATVTNNKGNTFTVVPEPDTVAMFGAGALLLGMTIYARRRS
jgi:hypothetical protein